MSETSEKVSHDALMEIGKEIDRIRAEHAADRAEAQGQVEHLDRDNQRLRAENAALRGMLRDWYETKDDQKSARFSEVQLDTGRLLRGDDRWKLLREES